MKRIALAGLLLCATSLRAQTPYVPTCLTVQQQSDITGAGALIAPKINVDPTDALMRWADGNCVLTQMTTSMLANIQTLNQNVAALQALPPGTGPMGPQGATGATGATGAQGIPGTAATIIVGATITGAPGSQAAVVNSGTSSAAVLNFTVPQGPTGPAGTSGTLGTAIIAPTATNATLIPAPCYPTAPIVGNTKIGTTVDFTVTIPAAGNYTFTTCSSAPASGATLHFEVPAGTKLGSSITVLTTGAWNSFQYQTPSAPITLPVGTTTVRVVLETAGQNLGGIVHTP